MPRHLIKARKYATLDRKYAIDSSGCQAACGCDDVPGSYIALPCIGMQGCDNVLVSAGQVQQYVPVDGDGVTLQHFVYVDTGDCCRRILAGSTVTPADCPDAGICHEIAAAIYVGDDLDLASALFLECCLTGCPSIDEVIVCEELCGPVLTVGLSSLTVRNNFNGDEDTICFAGVVPAVASLANSCRWEFTDLSDSLCSGTAFECCIVPPCDPPSCGDGSVRCLNGFWRVSWGLNGAVNGFPINVGIILQRPEPIDDITCPGGVYDVIQINDDSGQQTGFTVIDVGQAIVS